MATRTEFLATAQAPYEFPSFLGESSTLFPKREVPQLGSINRHLFSWEQLTSSYPLVHMLQPDYYMVFRFASPGTPVYQQNLSLDLGSKGVRFEMIQEHMDSCDMQHIQRMDRVMEKFAVECRLQPFDYICAILVRWNDPVAGQRYFMRKTTVLQCDARGIPCYGMVAFKEVTAMVSAIKPNNVDVTFQPDKANLCHELCRRIKTVQPKRTGITDREKEIVRCLCKGMSSKEIAAALFISKATVDTHRQNLIHKWEVTNTAALLQRVMEEGCF